jgi:hypothetical protein
VNRDAILRAMLQLGAVPSLPSLAPEPAAAILPSRIFPLTVTAIFKNSDTEFHEF